MKAFGMEGFDLFDEPEYLAPVGARPPFDGLRRGDHVVCGRATYVVDLPIDSFHAWATKAGTKGRDLFVLHDDGEEVLVHKSSGSLDGTLAARPIARCALDEVHVKRGATPNPASTLAHDASDVVYAVLRNLYADHGLDEDVAEELASASAAATVRYIETARRLGRV